MIEIKKVREAENEQKKCTGTIWEKIKPHTIGEKITRGGNAKYTRQFVSGVALLKFDMQCKIKAWIKNLNARNAGATNE